ncbi:hypothetical protein CAEBREN_31249 [Caenorhabditis brenneri]|uniref:DDHD domain-containing protein n=1 Tax=Caenorhabditis brenneri TaxID=135651 RepID=G0NSA1_CAEBE|nr:hypothetical protein CAEBREN_31249 [Caenorhabditis brenneri]
MAEAGIITSLPTNPLDNAILKPPKLITNDTPINNKVTGNNTNTPGELATGNNAPNAPIATETPDRHKPKVETKEQAARGNNEVELDFTKVASESFDVGKGFFLDVIESKEDEEERKKEAERRKKFLDANNEEDAPTIARAADSNVYPVIPAGAKLPSQVDNLRCSEVRWLYENEQGRLIPFSDKDSMETEIKYRLNNGIHLDPKAKDVLQKMENRDAISRPTHSKSGSVEETKSTDSCDDGKRPVIIGDGYYRVCKKNKWIHPVYWKNDAKKIVRGYYFTEDSKPIEEEEVKAINLNLERHFKKENNPDAKITYSDEITVGQTIIKFNSLVDFTIQRKGKNPVSVVRYPKEARWSGEEVEVEQLVFVVHGIWHNDNEQGIVDNAKLLIEGVKDHPDKATGIMFLPIHWRTNLEDDKKHKCDKNCSKESYDGKLNLILNDLKLYHCWFYGDKIRRRVLDEVNSLFRKFKSNNPNFKGKVSFFGHSLGSLICYDILTMESLESHRNEFGFKKVEKLFAVGSPLWFFIGEGGENAQKKFRKALESYRIFNIYHPTDFVASPLEPVILNPRLGIAIELPAAQDSKSQAFGMFLSSFASQFKNFAHWFVGKSPADKTDFELPHPIDHVLQTVGTLSEVQSHSIYWGHPSVFNFIKFVFARDSYTHQMQMHQNQENQSTSRMVLPASSSFSNLVEQFLEAIESEEQEAMFQVYNYSS